ncbi:uncharacterized protein A4U43_C08F4460 [Asparagus officinalis]|nr:uncharacterized protein A4U43_C08F4460 [Asparagus officinalis]
MNRYNMPVLVVANGGTGVCAATGCAADLNRQCPNELKLAAGDGCRSACEAFGTPKYCCSGEFANPNTCQPSVYSEMFKSACPRSYSYAYDDATSTFTCSGADYTITFCPDSVPSQPSTKAPSPKKKGVFLQDDSWLASLAIGDASPKMMKWRNHFLRQAAPTVITVSFSALLLLRLEN